MIVKLFTRTISTVLYLIVLFLLAGFVVAKNSNIDPLGLILTWQQDPTTTMTIDWHTIDDEWMTDLQYKPIGDDEWVTVSGEQYPFPFSDRIINRVELTGLEADTEYHFRFGENTRIRKFRTMPVDASRPIRFAAGGDVRHTIEWMDQTNRRAAGYDPDFVLWGGDLAYCDGLEERLYRWYEFMDSIMNTLITPDGRAIPVIAGIGNHEVLGGLYSNDHVPRREGIPTYSKNDESRALIAPYYYSLFAFPGQPGYDILDFGDYMSLVVLDTDHTNPVEGKQTAWLEKVLADRKHVPHIFPVYHTPAFPSVRDLNGDRETRVRENWVPLFEEYGVRVVFENHDHSYKRTHPIRDGEISSDGVIYIGDGAWGVRTRDIGGGHEEHAWYLKRGSPERHFIIGTIHKNHQHFLVVNEDGEIIDEYPRTPHVDMNIIRLAQPWISPSSEYHDH